MRRLMTGVLYGFNCFVIGINIYKSLKVCQKSSNPRIFYEKLRISGSTGSFLQVS